MRFSAVFAIGYPFFFRFISYIGRHVCLLINTITTPVTREIDLYVLTILYCTVLYYIVLSCIVYILLYCIVLCYVLYNVLLIDYHC